CFTFFFQPEDGIRDFHVTGVQTCALPIWLLAMEYDAIQASLGDNDDESAVVLSNEQEARLQERLQAVLASSPVFSIEPFVWKNEIGRASCRERAESREDGGAVQ